VQEIRIKEFFHYKNPNDSKLFTESRLDFICIRRKKQFGYLENLCVLCTRSGLSVSLSVGFSRSSGKGSWQAGVEYTHINHLIITVYNSVISLFYYETIHMASIVFWVKNNICTLTSFWYFDKCFFHLCAL
jgi:hypothetical protein